MIKSRLSDSPSSRDPLPNSTIDDAPPRSHRQQVTKQGRIHKEATASSTAYVASPGGKGKPLVDVDVPHAGEAAGEELEEAVGGAGRADPEGGAGEPLEAEPPLADEGAGVVARLRVQPTEDLDHQLVRQAPVDPVVAPHGRPVGRSVRSAAMRTTGREGGREREMGGASVGCVRLRRASAAAGGGGGRRRSRRRREGRGFIYTCSYTVRSDFTFLPFPLLFCEIDFLNICGSSSV